MAAQPLRQEARSLPIEERRRLLMEIPETELHEHLAQLFRSMDSSYWVEVTHGSDELGKDIVIVRPDAVCPDVIAVVVKRGDIRAKTVGDVDQLKEKVAAVGGKGTRVTAEILSQIAQAMAHKAAVPFSFATLQVTKVIVILAGDMSGQARTRLAAEVGPAGQVFDVAWLIDAFTEHYPQVFFDGHAVDYLDGLIGQLETDSFYSKSGKTLSECYVEPIVMKMESDISVDEENALVLARRRRLRLPQLMANIGPASRVLLIGDPGSGKSKALAKLCIDRYRQAFHLLTRSGANLGVLGLPLLVSARKVSEYSSAAELQDALLPASVRGRFSIQALLVDGLDEVPGASRAEVLDSCEKFAKELSCALLITSRKLASLSAPIRGYERYELLPFEFSQAMKLMEKILQNVGQLPAVKEGLERVRSQIPMNPLSLLLLVQLVTERKEIPSSITELYDRFLDLVFGRWDQEKGIEVLFEYVVKKRFLGTLAFEEFVAKDRLEIPVSDYDQFLVAYAHKYGWDELRLREFLKEVERAGILQAHDDVFFRHRSFLDYFAAYYLNDIRGTSADDNAQLAKFYFDGVWTEVAFFYWGMRREVSPEFLNAVFSFGARSEDHPIEKLLVGRVLQAGWHSPAAVKYSGVERAIEYCPMAAQVFGELIAKATKKPPLLYRELFMLFLSDMSLGSYFVAKETKAILEKLHSEHGTSEGALLKRMAMLWVVRRAIPPAEHRALLDGYLDDVRKAALGPSEEARMLVLGAIVEPENPAIMKGVNKRLRQLVKGTPDLLRSILPTSRPGFRKPSRRPNKHKQARAKRS